MRQSLTTEGFLLRKHNRSEADRIYVIYTKDVGKVVCIAKGVRKTSSRKRGHLEVFNELKMSLNFVKDFYYITEVQTVNNLAPDKGGLNKISLGYYFLEVVDKLTQENEPDKSLYDLLSNYLGQLRVSNKLKSLRIQFVKDVLVELGFLQNGQKVSSVDEFLNSIIERNINSLRVGKRILS